MSSAFVIKKGNLLPEFEVTLENRTETGWEAADLTGTTVEFLMADLNGTKLIESACTVITPASGLVKYSWTGTDTSTVGTYQGEFRVTSGGKARTYPNKGYLKIQVVEDLDT
jgi:hypothetical protein